MVSELPLICSLYGGAGTGKSTTAAFVFAFLKTAGINAELVTEFAKDLVWAGTTQVLIDHQIFVFATQLKRLDDLNFSDGALEVVVTDSPILLASVYAPRLPRSYHELVRSQYERMNNFNVKLKRVKPFNPKGRMETEEEAKALDGLIHSLDITWDLEAEGTYEGADQIFDSIMTKIGK